MVLFTACNSKQSAEESLKDDNHRKDIFTTIAQTKPYMSEMMNEMMNNDSCKQMMMDNMMSMCNEDSTMCKMMMGKTMEMCAMDESKCEMMMGCMKSNSKVMTSMEGMCSMGASGMNAEENHHDKKDVAVIYTCPMHPEIIRDKPGKCPKCGMDLVKKK